MKIAQIVCAFPPYRGGIGKSALILGNYLKEEHNIETFTLAPQNGTLSEKEKDTIYLRPWLRAGHGALPFSLLFKLRRYDCLYLHYPFFGAAELVWLYKTIHPRTKLVIHYHMDVAFSSGYFRLLAWPSKAIRRSLFAKADAIIAASLDYVRQSDIRRYLEDWPQKFHELPFSVDTETFKPKLPENRANSPLIAKAKEIVKFITHDIIKRRQTHFLFVGGLDSAHYFKGVDVMLQAASRLKRSDWKLSIVGEGDRKASYQKLCQDLDIAKQVEFLGAIGDAELIRHYQAADCFILPSINRNEAFGIVLIEAMACGLPVIASDLPGVRSVFRPGQEGLSCQPGDIESLKSAMEQMVSSQTMRERLGRAARAWAVERYSQEAIKAKLIRIFASL